MAYLFAVRSPRPWWRGCSKQALLGIAWGLALGASDGLPAAEAADSPILANLSFEQLSEITITTASKRAESLAGTAAAVTVVTGEEIHRSGVDSIPAALRGVTGLSVAQINGSTWGVGARGFSSQFAAKLLVMIDGRSVYTPVFGGVFWDTQDYLLADLDRIEVVLGTGGSLWGANAMNGVINILTKRADETQGDLVTVGTGLETPAGLGVRHGWQPGPETFARLYLKYRATRGTFLPDGTRAGDATQFLQGGWRMDGTRGTSRWTLQGDAYRGWNDYRVTLGSLAAAPLYAVTDTRGEKTSGANVLGRWDTTLATGGTLRWQAYLDYAERAGSIFDFCATTADVEMQHTLPMIGRQQIEWGVSSRRVDIRTDPSWVSFVPPADVLSLESLFAQDKIALVPDRLALTAGIKLEHSSASGLEMQPSVRLAWLPSNRHTLWAGWSRAVRTPAYTELANRVDAVVFPPGTRDPVLPVAIRGFGNPDLRAETLRSLEAGWRWRATEALNVTLTAYLNSYSRLIKVTSGTPFLQTAPAPALIIALPEDNGMAGRTQGGELAVRWQVQPHWRLDLGYAYTRSNFTSTTPDPFNFLAGARSTPRNTASVLSSWEFASRWELVAITRYVDPAYRFTIPAYFEGDLRVAWHPRSDCEIALAGRNLFQPRHPEFRPSLAGPSTEIARTIDLYFTWKR